MIDALVGRETRLHADLDIRVEANDELRDTDRHDVAVLCSHFGIKPPDGYA